MVVSNQDPITDPGARPGIRAEPSVSLPPASPGSRPTRAASPHGPRRGWIAAIVAALVVAAVALTVPAGAPLRRPWGDPPVAAVQTAVEQANREQAQALASGNPSLMSDTATTAYYRQLVQTNQDLAAQGATGLQLVQFGWGPVTINGGTATATTTET